jgi:hypothetical protein
MTYDPRIQSDPIETSDHFDTSITPPVEVPMIYGKQIYYAPQAKLTTASSLTINTGDGDTNTALNNMKLRIGELETRLQKLGLLKKN